MRHINLILFGIILSLSLYAQEKLEVAGSIKISQANQILPKAGTIRWTGNDFEGFNGFEWISLTGASSESTVTDIDGNIYKTRKIGDQIWMTENLRTTKYSNGTIIPNVINDVQWSGLVSGAWCWYSNINSFEIPYGKLYNWYAVNNSNGLCPVEWHIPLESEWLTLGNFLGGLSIAGGKMKEAGIVHWDTPNQGATNESGFTALPGGLRDDTGFFSGKGQNGVFWSSDEMIGSFTNEVELTQNQINLNPDIFPKVAGLSVRCVK